MDSNVAAKLKMECLVLATSVAREQHVFYSIIDDAKKYWAFVSDFGTTPKTLVESKPNLGDDIPF